jgi:hypothetical protein
LQKINKFGRHNIFAVSYFQLLKNKNETTIEIRHIWDKDKSRRPKVEDHHRRQKVRSKKFFINFYEVWFFSLIQKQNAFLRITWFSLDIKKNTTSSDQHGNPIHLNDSISMTRSQWLDLMTILNSRRDPNNEINAFLRITCDLEKNKTSSEQHGKYQSLQ